MTTRRRVGLPPGLDLAGWLRHTLWRHTFHAIGGFRVTGSAPYEAMVIVANHASHADTPALIGAFPAPYKPVVVAADDYWFRSRWRRLVLRIGIGGVPVEREGGGGYDTLVAAAQQVLGAGSSLLVFPEGTRSLDGEVGHFHSGPLRIAKEFDVPLLPVAVVGTHDLLPKRGGIMPGPVEVRLGRAIQPEELDESDPERIRTEITALLDQGPPRPTTSRMWSTLRGVMGSRAGLVGAAGWGFAEAISSPLTQEVYLATFGASHLRRQIPTALALTAGSVAGVLVTAVATRRGHRPPQPLTTDRMRTTAAEHLARGASGFWGQALNGVPVKVYAAEAGRRRLPLLPVALHAAGARGARALAIAVAAHAVAPHVEPFLRRFFGQYLTVFAVVYAEGLRRVVRHWR